MYGLEHGEDGGVILHRIPCSAIPPKEMERVTEYSSVEGALEAIHLGYGSGTGCETCSMVSAVKEYGEHLGKADA
jgi:hypothetical protein